MRSRADDMKAERSRRRVPVAIGGGFGGVGVGIVDQIEIMAGQLVMGADHRGMVRRLRGRDLGLRPSLEIFAVFSDFAHGP